MKTKLLSLILGINLLASSVSAALLYVVPTSGERLVIWNSTQKILTCPETILGEENIFEFEANTDDLIILYQTDRSCYLDFGNSMFIVDDPYGTYEVEF